MYSTETFTGVAGQLTYAFTTLRFLSSAHLSVTVDGSPASFTVNSARTQFTLSGMVPVGGETIVVTRTTPATEAGRLVDFNDLGHLRQRDLDTSSLQLLYIAQEALDVIAAAERLELSAITGQWDGESRRIQAVADGVDPTDAATKGQLDAASLVAGNLPVVSTGDNDKSLWVVAGAWAVRTPAQARVHLALGTAAVLNVGTAANNVVQLDGSARYPTADGRNIDLSANAITTSINLRRLTTMSNVLQSTEATPATDATATWSQTAGSRLTPGTATDLDNSSDITVDNTGKKVTLSAGTWEIEYIIRAYNVDAVAGNHEDLRVKVTNDDDTAGQTVYDTDNDRVAIESPSAATRGLVMITNQLLVKLPSGGTIVLRAVNADAANIRIATTRMIFRKVSTSTT